MVVFGDENGFGIGCAVAVSIDGFTNPDVVVIVGVFDDLNSVPDFFHRIPFLFGDFRQTVSIVPLVEYCLCLKAVQVVSEIGKYLIQSGTRLFNGNCVAEGVAVYGNCT